MKKTKSNKDTVVNVLNTVIIVFLSLVLIGSVGGFFVLSKVLDEAPPLDPSALIGQESSEIFDADSQVITELAGIDGNRENIEYEQIPQVVIDAYLAIEDSRFFKHNGFDLPRFIKSAINNLKSGSLSQGGSTLTMQLIDVAQMSQMEPASNNLQKIIRKIQEIFLSMHADSQYGKKDIIELYLNKINYGGARGIQKGAEYYFSKDISQITLSEAAFLAGVVNAPNAFDPYYHYDAAVQRRNDTLTLMLNHGYITQMEYDMAINTELVFQLGGPKIFETTPYLSYIDKVIVEVEELTGGLNPYTTPMEIYTSMDKGAQDLADAILNGEAGINYPQNDDLFQVGFSLMNNQTGEIVALGAGRGYYGDNRNSRAFIQQRQTGSSIKPILDYALTFDYLGYATSHVFNDAPMNYRGTNIQLYNADGLYRGDVTYTYAIQNSLNTTAMQRLEQLVDTLGINKIIEYMQSLGFAAFEGMTADQFNLGFAIGGSDMVSTPVEMAGSFSIFANNGNYIKPHTVTKIVFKDGKTPDIIPNYDSVNVISEQSAYLTSILLRAAVESEYANLLQIMLSPYPVYGKTGTSDWAEDGLAFGIPKTAMKDKWMVNYTSKYTVATWAGYDEPVAGKNTYVDTTKMLLNVPGQINRKLFDYIHQYDYPEAISQPSGVVSLQHIKGAFDNGYFAVPEGTPEEMITSGYIKSEFANLKELTADPIESLESFNVNYNQRQGIFEFEFTPYPDAEMVVPFDGKYHGANGFSNFEGTKIFDKKAVFGEVVYRVDINNGPISLGSYDYSSEKATESLAVPDGQEIEVCGYYAYKNSGESSNKICSTVTIDPLEPNEENEGGPNHGDHEQRPNRPDELPENPENPEDPTDE